MLERNNISEIVTGMSSRLVETVMINVEDFSDSFLTCGTCFSCYDSSTHSAKLLPCSHTVCRTCLEKILETQTDEETMRCPICRETILVPPGGASTFPPAFIVNQLIDLMATQRRDRVPKCRRHPTQELLFCETCDIIFCPDCKVGSVRGHATEACGGGGGAGPLALAPDINGVTGSGGGGGGGAALSHNVISFSVAIKRCSEILLYKASLCVQELNSAQEAVAVELDRLTVSTDACIAAAESSFAEIRALVEQRQAEVMQSIKRISEEKRRALEDQLTLIESERSLVREQCDGLKNLVDVRSISKGISYLNDKLDTIASLTEPRENAFLCYQDNPIDSGSAIANNSRSNRETTEPVSNSSSSISARSVPGTVGFVDVARCLGAFGRITVSTTYPPLCTASIPDVIHVHLPAKVLVRAYDYHGEPQTIGTDPITVRFVDSHCRDAPFQLVDLGNGTYEITLLPVYSGPHNLAVCILSRPIRGSPFDILVRKKQKPRWSITQGIDGRGLVQPFAVAVVKTRRLLSTVSSPSSLASGNGETRTISCSGEELMQQPQQVEGTTDPSSADSVLLLDTGNSRVLVADSENGTVLGAIVNDALKGQAATGMALSSDGLWVVNWRSNGLMLLDLATNEIRRRINSPRFVEPTSICVCPLTGRVLVADNGAGCILACNIRGEVTPLIGVNCGDTSMVSGSRGLTDRSSRNPSNCVSNHRSTNDTLRRVTGICVTSSGEIVLAAGSELRIYSSEGVSLGSLYPPVDPGFPNLLHSSSNSDELGGFPTLPLEVQRTTSLPPVVGPCSAPGSTLDLDSTPNRRLRRPPSIGGSIRPFSGAVGLLPQMRGYFGGVTVAPTDTHDLGECLLASHADRTRSAVLVYPEVAWRGVISGMSCINSDFCSLLPSENPNQSSKDDYQLHGCQMQQARGRPYALEVDPSLRRLAGLTALPGKSAVVVVDLGGQCAHCIRYA